jgi:hypothetical protein
MAFIPQLIKEIPYFKIWVLGCLKNDHETLVGHIDMHIFRFFVDLSRSLVQKWGVVH